MIIGLVGIISGIAAIILHFALGGTIVTLLRGIFVSIPIGFWLVRKGAGKIRYEKLKRIISDVNIDSPTMQDIRG